MKIEPTNQEKAYRAAVDFIFENQPPFPRPPDFATYFAKGYEGQEGYDRQAGPTQWLFQGPPAESKVLAARMRKRGKPVIPKVSGNPLASQFR